MTSSNFRTVDILRKRREVNSLQDRFFIDTKKYIKKGIYIGISIISISTLIGILFIFRSNIIERKKTKLQPLVNEYDSLQIKLNNESKELKSVAAFNKNLKESIVNISSSSALISEVSSIIPSKMQLISFNSSNSSLNLKSQVPNNNYLDLINGFLLGLDNSIFINFSEIDLTDIKAEQGIGRSKYYQVNIKTKITFDFDEINQKALKKLGSYGLLNRIEILKSLD
tara:strand:- start:127 stop:804 length:678 start_codon:yes stop_codon:yes gene_type:complete